MANPVGRPRKWESPEQLQGLIDDYFAKTPQEEWMITALALHLDTTRETLWEYEKVEGFSDPIKKAKERIALQVEKRLRTRGSAADIFIAKNFGWRDKQEVDQNHSGEINITWQQ